jgi:hypothetical protein
LEVPEPSSVEDSDSIVFSVSTDPVAAVDFLRPLLTFFEEDLEDLTSNSSSLKSTSSMIHISALSPKRFPVLMIRVYPPGLSPIFSTTSSNKDFIESLF